MTPSDLPEFGLVKGLWVDRKIPNFQIPRPNGFFLGHLEEKQLGNILIITK